MKFKSMLLVCILLAILTMGVVSAEGDSDFNETLTAGIDEEVSVDASYDDEMISGESDDLVASSHSDVIGDDSDFDAIIHVDSRELHYSDQATDGFASVSLPDGVNARVVVSGDGQELMNKYVNDFQFSWPDGANEGHTEYGINIGYVNYFRDINDGDSFEIAVFDDQDNEVNSKEYVLHMTDEDSFIIESALAAEDFNCWISNHESIIHDWANICEVSFDYDAVHEGTLTLIIEKDGEREEYARDIEEPESINWQLGDLEFIDEYGDYAISVIYGNEFGEINLVSDAILKIRRYSYNFIEGDIDINFPFHVIRAGNEYDEEVIFKILVNGEEKRSNDFWAALEDLDITAPGEYNITIQSFGEDDFFEEISYTINVDDSLDNLRVYYDNFGVINWQVYDPVLYLVCPDDQLNQHLTLYINDEYYTEFDTESLKNWTLSDLDIDENGDYDIRMYDDEDNEVAYARVAVWSLVSEENFNWRVSSQESKENDGASICEVWINNVFEGGLILSIETSEGVIETYEEPTDGTDYIRWELGDLDIINEFGIYKINLTYSDGVKEFFLVENKEFALTQLNYNFCEGEIYIDYPFDIIRFYPDDDEVIIEVYVGDNENPYDAGGENPLRWTLEDLGITAAGEYTITIKTSRGDEDIDEFSYSLNVYDDTSRLIFFADQLGVESWELEGPVLYLFCPDDMFGHYKLQINGEDFGDFEVDNPIGFWFLHNLEIDRNGDYDIRIFGENDGGEMEELAGVWLNVNGMISEDSFDWWISSLEPKYSEQSTICEVGADDINSGRIILSIENPDGDVKEYDKSFDQDNNFGWELQELDILEETGIYLINLTYEGDDDSKIVLAENYVFRLTELNYKICEDVHVSYPFEIIRFYSQYDEEEDASTYIVVSINGVEYNPNGENPFRWYLDDLNITQAGEYTIKINAFRGDGPVETWNYTLNVRDDDSDMEFYSSQFEIASWDIDKDVLYLFCPDDMLGENLTLFIDDVFLMEFEAETSKSWTLEDLGIDRNGEYEIRLYNQNDDEIGCVYLNVRGILSEDTIQWDIPTHGCKDHGIPICNVWIEEYTGQGTLILSIEKFDGTVETYKKDLGEDNYFEWNIEETEIIDELGKYTINLTFVIGDEEIALAENRVFQATQLGYDVCEDVYYEYPFDVIRVYNQNDEDVTVFIDGTEYPSPKDNPFRWKLEDLNINGAGEYEITIKTFFEGELIDEFTYTLHVVDEVSEVRMYSSEFGIRYWEIGGPVLYLLCPDDILGHHLRLYIDDDYFSEFNAESFMNWTYEELRIEEDGDYEIRLYDGEDEIASTWLSIRDIEETRLYAHIWDADEDGPIYSDMQSTIVYVHIPIGTEGIIYVLVDGEVKYVTNARYHSPDEDSFFGYAWNVPNLNLTEGTYDISVVFFNGEDNETLEQRTVNVVRFNNDSFRARYCNGNMDFELFCPDNAVGTITVFIYDEKEDDELVGVFTHEINETLYNKWTVFAYGEYAFDEGYRPRIEVDDIELRLEASYEDYEGEVQMDWIEIRYGDAHPEDVIMIVSYTYDRDLTDAHVTVTNGNYTFTKKLTELLREWNANCYDYFVTYEDLEEFEQFKDKDIITFTFKFYNGKQSRTACLQKDGDEIRLYRLEEILSDIHDLFEIRFKDEEEGDTAFNITEGDVEFITVTVPETYNVKKAEIRIESGNKTIFYKAFTDFDYEFDYEYGMGLDVRTYLIGDMNFSSLNDRDIVNFTLIFDGKVIKNYQYSYRIIEEDMIEFDDELGDHISWDVRWGAVGDPEYGQGETDGRLIILDIPNDMNVTEGTIQFTDDDTGNLLYSIALSEISDVDDDDGLTTYTILAKGFAYDEAMPDGVNFTITFNYNDTQLVMAKGIRIGNNTQRHVMPEELAEYFEVTLQDRVLIDGNDDVIYIYTTPASNRQSVPIGLGNGHFSVYVNGKKVEDLGRLIRVDGETELDIRRLENDYRHLYIYLEDLNITENGIYDIKVNYEVDEGQDSETTGSYKTELYHNNITLASNVKVNYENESVEWLTGYGVDPVLLYLDTYYGDINSTNGTITVLNSDNDTILTKNIKDLTYENGRYSLRYSDFTDKNFGDKITVKYGDGNERSGETSLDVLWRDVEPDDFNTTVTTDLDDYYGNFVSLDIPAVINTGQIIVTVKFKNNHSSNISNMDVSTDFDSHAVYTFNVADIKANYDNGKFALALSDLEFYEVDGTYNVDVKFSGDGTSTLDVANKTFDVALSDDVIITVNETSRFGLELPFASVQIFEPMGAYAELYIDGVLYSHKTFEKGLIEFMSSPRWTPGVHTAEIKVVNSQFEVILNQSKTTFEVLVQSGNIEVTVPEIIKENIMAYVTFNAPVNGTLLIRVDNGNIEFKEVHEGENQIPLGSLAYGNHTVWMLYNETLEDGSLAFYNNLLYIFAGDDGHWVDLPNPLVLNDDDTIRFDLGADATGNISLYIDNVLYKTINLTNGTAEIKIDEEFFNATGKYGVHNYTIIYSGDDTHPELMRNGTFNVEYLFRDNIPMEGFPLSDIYIIVIVLPADAKNNVTFTINNTVYNCPVVDGQATLELEDFDMGEYDVDISYLGDEKYPQTTYTKVLSVSYYGVVGYIKDGRRIVSLRLPTNAKGNLTIYNDNRGSKLYTKALVNGRASFDLTDLPVGMYDLRAVYEGDDYSAKDYRDNFKVMPYVYITQDVLIDDDVTIFMDLNNSTGYILIVMDGLSPVLQEIADGKVNYTFSTKEYSFGNHTVTFQYFGNSFDGEIFYESDSTGKLVPIKYDLRILGKEANVAKASDLDNYLELYFQNATGTVEFFVNGVKYAVVDIVDGIARLDISKFKNGKYLISWVYSGDSKYKSTSNNMYLTVNHKSAKITAADFKTLYTSNKKYSVKVYNAQGKLASGVSVTFLINNKAFKTVKTDKKGVASVVISQKPGTYKITAKALSTSVTKKLTVNHVLTLKKVKVKASAKKLVIKATLKKVNGKYLKGKKITLKFNGKKFKAKTNKKGVAKFTIKSSVLKKLKAGKKVKYQATYKKDTVKKSVKVKK